MGKPEEGQQNQSRHPKKQHHSNNGKQQQGGFTAAGSAKPPATPAAPPRKYVVVIRNVENDFSRVHTSALERYFRLNRSLEKTRLGKTIAAAAAASNSDASAPIVVPANTDVTFEIKARTETRSAELRIYAPSASADISSAWTPSNNYSPAAAEEGEEGSNAEGFAVGSAGGRFSSLTDMVSVLKQKPYLVYPPTFMTGGNGGSEEAVADGESTTSTNSGVVRQTDFITVELVTSSYTSNKNLKKVLADVPGFITSWPLYTMHFRGIFANESSLFRSKSLLDQFEAEGLRINVVLPDVVARKYEAYLTHQADE